MLKNFSEHYIEHFGDDLQHNFHENIQRFVNEHGPMLDKIVYLINEVHKWLNISDENLSTERLKELFKLQKELKAELDNHSDREEKGIFKLLDQYIASEHSPIEIMELEHEEIRKNFSLFTEKAELLIQNSDKNENNYLKLYLEKAYEIIQQHFYKEENAIFPMAEQLLSDEEKKKIL